MGRMSTHSSSYIGDTDYSCGPRRLTISESELNFRLTLEGERTPVQTVVVSNTGLATIKIQRVQIVHGKDNFRLANANSYPSALERTQSFNILVDFMPSIDGVFLGLLEIFTNENPDPYIISLVSRVRIEDPEEDDPLHTEILNRIAREVQDRENGDNRVSDLLTQDITRRVGIEAVQRINAINNESTARRAADLMEKALRETADTDLRNLIAAIQLVQNYYGSIIELGDQVARASIRDEIIVRINSIEAEAIARRTLEVKYDNGIAETNARIVEESRVYATQYEALASRTEHLEVSFVSPEDIDFIISAQIGIERQARVTALLAEAYERTTLGTNMGNLITSRIAEEVYARSTAVETLAGKISTLQANYSSGNTPGVDTQARASITDEIEARSNAIASEITARLALSTFFTGALGTTNAALNEETRIRSTQYDSSVSQINNILAKLDLTIASPLGNSIISVDARVTEERTARVSAMEAEARRVDALIASIDVGGEPFDPEAVNALIRAAVEEERVARVTAAQAEATRIANLLTSYATTSTVNAAITTAISSEVTNRETSISNAVGAEASRVNGLLANYATTSGVNGLINSAISAEVISRTTAIANAVASEVTRVDTLLTSYSTTSAVGALISTASQTEVTARTTAISDAIGAEVTRVNNLLASYATNGGVSSSISAAVTEEARLRALADGSLAELIGTVSTTVNGFNSTITSNTNSINGILAKQGVRLDVNGYVTGYQQINDGRTGDFIINADNFAVLKPGGGARTEYSGGNWRCYDANGVMRTRMGVWA